MTISELIKRLEKYPADTPVEIQTPDDEFLTPSWVLLTTGAVLIGAS